jgi:hypothetical protein
MITAALSSAAAQHTATETAVPLNCFMLNGYDMVGGCKSPATTSPPDCSALDAEDDTSPCIETDYSVHEESEYEKLMTTTQDQKDFVNTITNAEGGGWGVGISASVGVMKNSQMSGKSVTMTVGSAKTLYRKKVRNYPAIPLSNASTSLLSANPDIFVMAYGIHYIAEIVYGGSFLGYQNLAQSHEYGADSLDVFAKLDINETMFTAGGSENFTNTHSKLQD